MRQVDRRRTLQLLAAAGGVSIAGEPVTAGSRSETKANSAAATQTTKLTASDGAPEHRFGSAVAIEGDRALIGARGDTPDGRHDDDDGAAYTFERSGGSWSEQGKKNGENGENFGNTVAFDGETALIGGVYAGFNGKAYLYEWDGGSLTFRARFSPENFNPSGLSDFGRSVALDGDTLLIGSPEEGNPNGIKSGAAYAFEQSNGGWKGAKLVADDGEEDDELGRDVALSGDTALVGAPYDENSNGFEAGAVYVFERSDGDWSQQAKLTADDGNENDLFGGALALEGSTALIGAYTDDLPDTGRGSVYVFERADGNWSQQAKLTAADGSEWFGFDVALEGTTALIGAQLDDDPNGQDAGSAYTFEKSDGDWSQQTKLSADDGDDLDRFGYSVALSGDTALVGAFHDEDPNGTRAGSAYVFDLSEESGGDGPPAIVGGDPPTDPDGDGLYEDVDGDGDFTIGDVQVFFQNRNSDVVQDNAEFFNFSGGGQDEVTIADVQVLFQELTDTDE